MVRYECTICGFVYDPRYGLPDDDIEPGTSFQELPEDWVCPDCGSLKRDFIAEDE